MELLVPYFGQTGAIRGRRRGKAAGLMGSVKLAKW